MNKKLFATIALPLSYIIVALVATIVAAKVTTIAGYAVSAAMLLYPLTFILKDAIQKRLGKSVAKTTIWLSAGAMLFASTVFLLIGMLPADVSWVNQEAYDAILTPVLRLTVASIIAGVIAELVDTAIFSYLFKRKGQYVAALGSNAVSIALDSALFATIAFAGTLPVAVVVSIGVTAAILKYIIAFVFSPTIFLVKRTAEDI